MNLKFLYLQLLCLAVCLPFVLLSGCSKHGRPSPAGSSAAKGQTASGIEIDLFTAKAFLGGSDYERYHMKDDVLWRECGQVDAKRKRVPQKIEGDDILGPDPNLVVRERRVENLTREARDALRDVASDFLVDYARSQRKPPAPGSVFSVTDGGMFELSVSVDGKKQRLVTSVDALSDADKRSITVVLESALGLFEKIRGVGPVICEAPTFFGIARRSL